MVNEAVKIELTAMQARALRSAISWSRLLAIQGKLELYEWQAQAFDEVEAQLNQTNIGKEA